jgi:drug/metabolite transporter (DMT)-like permease
MGQDCHIGSGDFLLSGLDLWATPKKIPPCCRGCRNAGWLQCLILPLALIFESPMATCPNIATWGSILAIALLCTSVAYLMCFHILAKIGATNLMLVTFLVPVSALALGVLILGEELNTHAFIGMVLIFTGLVCVDGRLFKCHSTF